MSVLKQSRTPANTDSKRGYRKLFRVYPQYNKNNNNNDDDDDNSNNNMERMKKRKKMTMTLTRII